MDVLNLKIGRNKRKLKIIDIKVEHIVTKDKDTKKVVFVAIDECTNNIFNISDAWFNIDNLFVIKGLWLVLQNEGDEISKACSLAKMMHYYNKETLKEFIGEYIYAYPDSNNFLVLISCNLPENL